jgi:hypothetical protein
MIDKLRQMPGDERLEVFPDLNPREIHQTPARLADGSDRLEKFPDFGPRNDMQNPIHLHLDGHQTMLIRHLGRRETTLVLSEVPVFWYSSRNARIPDLTIDFGVNPAAILDRNGYSIEENERPPDFVLEVASLTTARNDYTRRREDYAAFGIPEYWRFDPTGGRRYDAPLAGDRLVEGVYQPIELVRVDDERLWGHSGMLNLDVCWEYGRLRWWDPVARQYLQTHEEEAAGRAAAEQTRMAAEADRDAALNRVRELEEELRRRRDS